jgi:hypothetical protein
MIRVIPSVVHHLVRELMLYSSSVLIWQFDIDPEVFLKNKE